MRRCPCSRGMVRERCSCKDFEAVLARRGSLFHEAMYNCHCFVGKFYSKCDYFPHIEAIDLRTSTFIALGEFDRAKKDAEWMIELAPQMIEVRPALPFTDSLGLLSYLVLGLSPTQRGL